MVTINDETFVDGTFSAGNIIYGRTVVDGTHTNSARSKAVVFGQDGADSFTAGSGAPFVFVTGYTANVANRLDDSGSQNIGVTNVTATGFTIHAYRTASTIITVYWLAIRNP